MPIPEAGELGVWGGFLDRLPMAEAMVAAQRIERAGFTSVWLQEWSGIDPFVRAAAYLSATDMLRVGIGVANIYARDPEAMVAVACTIEEAFPGRLITRTSRRSSTPPGPAHGWAERSGSHRRRWSTRTLARAGQASGQRVIWACVWG